MHWKSSSAEKPQIKQTKTVPWLVKDDYKGLVNLNFDLGSLYEYVSNLK